MEIDPARPHTATRTTTPALCSTIGSALVALTLLRWKFSMSAGKSLCGAAVSGAVGGSIAALFTRGDETPPASPAASKVVSSTTVEKSAEPDPAVQPLSAKEESIDGAEVDTPSPAEKSIEEQHDAVVQFLAATCKYKLGPYDPSCQFHSEAAHEALEKVQGDLSTLPDLRSKLAYLASEISTEYPCAELMKGAREAHITLNQGNTQAALSAYRTLCAGLTGAVYNETKRHVSQKGQRQDLVRCYLLDQLVNEKKFNPKSPLHPPLGLKTALSIGLLQQPYRALCLLRTNLHDRGGGIGKQASDLHDFLQKELDRVGRRLRQSTQSRSANPSMPSKGVYSG